MSSGFVTEAEAADIRKRRQEEWENVRKPSDPIERPEEPYDNRSLFDRLQEQKQKRDLEYEETHKLKNMIKGLDDDEIEFLDVVDRVKLAAERKKDLEEEKELNDYRNRVQLLQEKSIEERLQAEKVVSKPKTPSNNKMSQQKLLKGIVVKKSYPVKRKMSSSGSEDNENSSENSVTKQQKVVKDSEKGDAETSTNAENATQDGVTDGSVVPDNSALKCIGILPGLGCYDDSSSDENSSNSSQENVAEEPMRDLTGRRIHKVEVERKSSN